MKLLDKIADWVVAKPYRYWIIQWLLYTVVFLCACFTVAMMFTATTK